MSDRRRGASPVTLAVLGLFGLAIFSAHSQWQARDDARALLRHHRLASVLLEAEGLLGRSEKAQRDYLLSGQLRDLEACGSAVFQLDASLRRAGELAIEEELRAQLRAMTPLLAEQAVLLQQSLDTASRQGRAAATRLLSAAPARERSDQLSAQMLVLRQEEALRLEHMTGTLERRAQDGRWWLGGAALLLLAAFLMGLRRPPPPKP